MAEEKRIVVENRMDTGAYMQKTVDRGVQPPHDPWQQSKFYWMHLLKPPATPYEVLGMGLSFFFPSFITTAGLIVFWEPLRYFDLLRFVVLGLIGVLAVAAFTRYTVRTTAPQAVFWLDARLFIALSGIVLAFVLFIR